MIGSGTGQHAIFFAARELREKYGAAALPNCIISKTDGGTLTVAIEAATAHLQSLLLPSTPAPKVEPKSVPADKGEKKVSCSAVARDLILAGKTNDEVWAVIAEQFKLDQKKRGYPAWYRFQLRKTGHAV